MTATLKGLVLDPGDVDECWSKFSRAVYDCASSVVGLPERKHQDWFDDNNDEIRGLLKLRNRLVQALCSDPNSQSKAEKLRDCKSKLQRKLRVMKNSWLEARVKETQHYADTNNSRKFFESIKAIYGPSHSGTTPLLSKDGSTRLTDKTAIIKRWAEHFDSVLNRPSVINSEAIERLTQVPTNHHLDNPPTTKETKAAIEQLSLNKSPGADSIPAEIYSFGGETLARKLTELFTIFWEAKCLPQEFKDAEIVHLYKNKGDRQVCDNHRGISLLVIAGKLLARILLNRLQDHLSANELIPESQCGFRKNRGTADMIFAARQIQEKCIEQNMALYITFVDLTKAFDTVCRDGLWKIMAKFGCAEKFIHMVRQFHDRMQACVRSNGSNS